jgi:UDP-N-acetylmuramate: L-alanyl-gamma-D-glutamyl-meso-diaminopimelate ligase
MKIHFISIGGSVMHHLAIALKAQGHQISGSDDEIYEPSFTRLKDNGLLPSSTGWNENNIASDLDAVIVGMHARKDNPELLKAQKLGIKVYSYPEYIYQHSQNKERIVIAGSHGKTTTTAMVMHVLQYHRYSFDYVIGATAEGFDTTVRLSADAPIIVIEGDEYYSSPIDLTPKFLHYKHHIGLVSGIAWDHINVYPDMDDYVKQFERFAAQSPKAGTIIYCEEDYLATLACSSNKMREDVLQIEYITHAHKIKNGITYLKTEFGEIPLQVFGKHNMQNISGAKAVCSRLAISDEMFYEAIKTFKGASKRLELVAKNANTHIFRDFAHAPSKINATTEAVKEQFPHKELVICAELHTFSSLNKNFLPQYKNTVDKADLPIIYFNPKTLVNKRLEPISEQDILQSFAHPKLKVFTDSEALKEFLEQQDWQNKNLLLMSSGTFDGIDFKTLSEKILAN